MDSNFTSSVNVDCLFTSLLLFFFCLFYVVVVFPLVN